MSAPGPASGQPFNDYSSWIRRQFGGRVQKLSIDAGFSCPNRDGTLGRGGCAYCTNASFVPAYCDPGHSVSRQIEQGIGFFSWKYPEQQYLAYFQANSSTHGASELLKDLLDQALAHPSIRGLVVGTRPDSIGPGMLEVLASAAARTWLHVELGIESTIDRSLARVGRGHGWQAVVDAADRLHQAGISLGGHLILGLPGESRDELLEHAIRINALPLATLKIHHLQILEGTRFAIEFRQRPEEFQLFGLESYLGLCADFLERLRPDLVIERLTNEAPENLLIAPLWGGIKNHVFTQRLVQKMHREGRWQGKCFTSNGDR